MKQKDLNMEKKQPPEETNAPSDNAIDSELRNIVEAALYAAKAPLGVKKLMALFPDDAQPSKVDIQNAITSLQEDCEHRGVELRRIGNGWRFQSKEKYASWLRKLNGQKAPRYSRALLETLSIIAYRQPVTRGDIEEIRGVGVSSETIRTLEEREWVAQIGHRDVPGRPALFGTTQAFLEYFNMSSLRELPELMEKRDLRDIAKDMNLTLPMDGVQTEDDQNNDFAEVIELHPEASSSPDSQKAGETDNAEADSNKPDETSSEKDNSIHPVNSSEEDDLDSDGDVQGAERDTESKE